MKYTTTAVSRTPEILYNDHYVAIPYDCSEIETNEQGIIPAGTIVPTNNNLAEGVLLHDVRPEENPNGTIVIHGFVNVAKMPAEPKDSATNALSNIVFIQDGRKYWPIG